LKNLNVTITEESDAKLEQIMAEKRLKNRPDAVDWIIAAAFEVVFGKGGDNR
jgi:hypothetical protein